MKTLARYRQALLCALLLLLSVLSARPYAEIGVNDDWSYIRTTQLFAETGHMVFNGWATAILGWQVWWGALFVKLFGPSFTAVRASILPIALLGTFLLQRCFVRAGADQWNATIATLTVMVSPVAIPLSFTFHTDMPATCCIIGCFYACFRALQSHSTAKSIAWLICGSLAADLGGFARQIAWLPGLTLIPAVAYLLRKNTRVVAAAALLVLSTLLTATLSLRWLGSHPYTVPEKLVPAPVDSHALAHLGQQLFANVLNLPFYLLPLFLVFLICFPYRRRGAWIMAASLNLCLLLFFAYLHRHLGALHLWLIPSSAGVITPWGALQWQVMGTMPVLLDVRWRALLTALTVESGIAFITWLVYSDPSSNQTAAETERGKIGRHEVHTLLLAFAVPYFAILIPRATFWFMLDRYLLPLYIVAAIWLVLLLQDHVAPKLPQLSLVTALLLAALGTAFLHDLFVTQRAKLQAANELIGAGVPRTRFIAGFEYDTWTQVLAAGHVTDYRMAKRPPGEAPGVPFSGRMLCRYRDSFLTPAIRPLYYLSYDPEACLGRSTFAPVSYKTWLGPPTTIYIVNAGEPPPTKARTPLPWELTY